MRSIATILLSGSLMVAGAATALAEKRVALVIGNSVYTHAGTLANPGNDATDLAGQLRRLGFEVVEGKNLGLKDMSVKLRDFTRAMDGADVGLFFYAGHGLQVNGVNYLAPVDAELKSQADLDFETMPLDLVLKQMERSVKTSLVFLDACRNSPLARSLAATSRGGSVSSGLARVEQGAGMMIAFATQPGNVALDGDGRNSPFTGALLKYIATPGQTVGETMIKVRNDVMAATGERQVPWENSSLTGQFYFNPEGAKVASLTDVGRQATISVDDSALDHAFWTSIQNSADAKSYEAYLDRFPNGTFASLARLKIDALGEQKRGIVVEATQQVSAPAAGKIVTASVAPTASDATAIAAPAKTVTDEDVGARFAGLGADELALLEQKELKRLGCYEGSVDGNWGKGSTGAVERYMEASDQGLIADEPNATTLGVLSSETQQVCGADEAYEPETTAPRAKHKTAKRTWSDNDEPRKVYRKKRVGHIEEPVIRIKRHRPRVGIRIGGVRIGGIRIGGGGLRLRRGRIGIGISF